jgi:hypothetical protein
MAFSPEGNKAVTASKDKTWAVWNLDVRYAQDEDPKVRPSCTNCLQLKECTHRWLKGIPRLLCADSAKSWPGNGWE